jgi:hypothetical protein
MEQVEIDLEHEDVELHMEVESQLIMEVLLSMKDMLMYISELIMIV